MDERDNIGVEEKFVSSSLSLSKSNILLIQELMIMPFVLFSAGS